MDRSDRARPDGFGGRGPDANALDRDTPYGPRTLGATTDPSPGTDRGDVQRRADASGAGHAPAAIHAAAAHGIGGATTDLPYQAAIQQAFGHHDVGGIRAHADGPAREGAAAMGAEAFATGDHVAFAGPPSLHTAAHEAAHVVQQRAGVHLKGGLGQDGDPLEQHADAVADRVVRGESAEAMLDAHVGGRAAVAPGGDGAPVQRKIRVDAIDDGEAFEDTGYVQSHWGFTEAEKEVYRAWLTDGVDHQFATKPLLVAAVKAQVKPKTSSFATTFLAIAQQFDLSPAWLEQVLTSPEQTLGTLKLSTPTEILEIVNFGREDGLMTTSDLAKLTAGQLLDVMLKRGKVTQSCGQTSSLVHSVLAPTSYAQDKPVGGNALALRGAIVETNKRSMTELQHYYCRVEGGGHSFTLECWNDTVRIYQSFFNAYTMATDLDRGKSFTLGEFLALLDKALLPFTEIGEIPSEVGHARQALFSCSPTAFHPDDDFRTTIFKQESGVKERLGGRTEQDQKTWSGVKDDKATDHLKEEKVVSQPPAGTRFDIKLGDDRFLMYDGNYAVVSWDDLADGECVVRYMDAFVLGAVVSNLDTGARTCTITISNDDD